MSWTDERVELLKKMWNEGQSASQIAKELGGVTRNAVIGKVHRLGLSNRTQGGEVEAPVVETTSPAEPEPVIAEPAQPKPQKPAAEPEPVEPPTAEDDDDEEDEAPVSARRQIVPAGQPLPPQPSANEISAEALATVREVEKSSKRLTLMELTERTCKWPIGDPATEDFWFCGLNAQPGKPYCEAHVGVAFQPMSSRRDRRR